MNGALAAAQTVLNIYPNHWQALNFMGAILWHLGRRAESVAAIEKSIASAPSNEIDVRFGLVDQLLLAISKGGFNPDKAIGIMFDLIKQHKPEARFLARFTNVVKDFGRLDEALKLANMAVSAYPENPTLHRNKASVLMRMGWDDRAVAAYALSIMPYQPNTREAAKASSKEIRSHYAGLAASYDDNALHQSFSDRMAKFIVELTGPALTKRVLDAGCGTGLLGTCLKVARLVGIDRSPDMLAKARIKNIYAELVEGDLVEAMAARTDSFDIVASVSVLCHIADLAPFFRETARILVPGGHLFFSVDPAPDSMDIGVTEPGEYAHSRVYLRRLASECDFTEVAITVMEHRATPGFWCAFQRT